MPDFDLDAPLAFHPWDSFENLVTAATGGITIVRGTTAGVRTSYLPDGPQKPNEVLFYPGGGGDWQPLVKFPKCKIFLYCDLGRARNNSNNPLSVLAKDIEASHPELKFENPCEGEAFHPQVLAWEAKAAKYLESLWPAPERGSGHADELKQVIRAYVPTDQRRKRCTWVGRFERSLPGCTPDCVHVVYLTVEGLSAYLNLFFVNGIAPGVICLKPYVGFSCGQLSEKMLEAFGAVLKNDHAAHSSLIVVPPDRKANTPWMSKWSKVRHRFIKWGRTTYATK